MLQKRQFKEVYGVVKDDPSFYGRVLATGIAELPNGLAEAREAMERVSEVAHGGNGKEDQHAGRARHAGTDDRPAGHAQRDDRQLQRHRL